MNPENDQPGGATPESESARMEPFIPSETLAALADKEAPLVLVQGHAETARALLVAGMFPIGVETWSAVAIPIDSNGDSQESIRLHAAFDGIVFAKRKVYFHNSGNSDARAQLRLALLLAARGAEVFEVVAKNSEPLAKSMENAPDFFTTLNIADIPAVREELHRTQPDGGIKGALAKRIAKQLDTTKDDLLGSSAGNERPVEKGKIPVEDIEPWPEPVVLCEVLEEFYALIRSMVSMTPAQAVPCTLWPLTTFFYSLLSTHAFLAITAPTKRCGKTTLFKLLLKFCNRGLDLSANVSPAFAFRCIDKYRPTFAVDEAQFAFERSKELEGIYNAGHTRGANVGRVDEGPNGERDPVAFNVFCPKLLAWKGRPKDDSMQDRVIEIRLSRMTMANKVSRDYWDEEGDDLDEKLLTLRRKVARAAIDLIPRVKGHKPNMPHFANSRTRQNWRPLWLIAELAGGNWVERLKDAMRECEDDSFREMPFAEYLLTSLEKFCEEYQERPEILTRKSEQQDFIPTQDILDPNKGLNSDREAPWCADGKLLVAEKLGRELREFNIKSSQQTIDGNRHRCYSIRALKKAFDGFRK
jgi:putative DNA primase/helicase